MKTKSSYTENTTTAHGVPDETKRDRQREKIARAQDTERMRLYAHFLFSFSWFRCDFVRQAGHTYERMCQSDSNPIEPN